jgi:pyridoxamine 5'-phosphate oxidase-like protein
MEPTKITRPKFPPGYVDKPVSYLTWDWVAAQLTEAKHYWICSVRPPTPEAPGGRPHVVPRWCVYVDGKIYYDGSPETRHAINIRTNPNVTVHLENGWEAVILEGTTKMAGKPSPELGNKLAKAYKKYKE